MLLSTCGDPIWSSVKTVSNLARSVSLEFSLLSLAVLVVPLSSPWIEEGGTMIRSLETLGSRVTVRRNSRVVEREKKLSNFVPNKGGQELGRGRHSQLAKCGIVSPISTCQFGLLSRPCPHPMLYSFFCSPALSLYIIVLKSTLSHPNKREKHTFGNSIRPC